MIKKGIILFFLLKTCTLFTQTTDIFDSKNINEIEDIFNSFDKEQQKAIATKYLSESKKQQDFEKIIRSYYLKSLLNSHSSLAITYSDSIIKLSKKIKNKKWLTRGYIQKGIQLYYKSENSQALSIFLKIKESSNSNFDNLVTDHYIGLLKNASKQEKDALNIFRSNFAFFYQKEENQKKYSTQYLKSLFALADSYNRNNKLDSAQSTSILGIKKSYYLENKILYPHFLHSLATNFYIQKKYNLAVDSLKKAIPLLRHKPKSLCSTYMLAARIYKETNKKERYIQFLNKIDSIYSEHKNSIFHAREANIELFNFYKSNNANEKLINLSERILSIDSIIDSDYPKLGEKIIKKYDIPKLIKSRENLIETLNKNKKTNSNLFVLLVTFILVITTVLVYFVRKNIVYKRRFNKVLNTQNTNNKTTAESKVIISTVSEESKIPKKIVNTVITKLDQFEEQKEFTKKYTLNSLAKKLKTNTTYLSKIINEYKKDNFANYLNNLRVDFAIEKLKNDKKFRSFTIQAIANEVGFNTAQSFSNAFYKKTGIHPSYFIKNLKSRK